MKTCAANGWNVSCKSGYGVPTGMVEMSVFRSVEKDGMRFKPAYGDHNGRVMTHDEYKRFALEHGYTQEFRRDKVAVLKRVYAGLLARTMIMARKGIMDATTREDICDIAFQVKMRVRNLPGDNVLPSLAWSNGVYAMARALRSDIWS